MDRVDSRLPSASATLGWIMTEIAPAPSVRASLVLRGFGEDPELITRVLGRTPSRSGRAGEALLLPTGSPSRWIIRDTYWSLHSRLDPRAELSSHLGDIFSRLGEARHSFGQLPPGTTVALRCTVIPDGALPLISLAAPSLAMLSDLGAVLEIDIISVDASDDTVEPAVAE